MPSRSSLAGAAITLAGLALPAAVKACASSARTVEDGLVVRSWDGAAIVATLMLPRERSTGWIGG